MTMAQMDIHKLRKRLMDRLSAEDRELMVDRRKETLRIEDRQTKKGITVELAPLLAKWEQKKEGAIDETVYFVEEALRAMRTEWTLIGSEKRIYPVIRSTSFPVETEAGGPFLTDPHTAETRIYYAIDSKNAYRLIDRKLLEKEGWDERKIREIARFNIRALPAPLKKDSVAGNDFYFVNTNDGYDASRILNETLLKEMENRVRGKLVISIPHQDVLIFADVQNEAGYDVMAQMTVDFFAGGRVPITPLSFYFEHNRLEPIFIMAKKRPR